MGFPVHNPSITRKLIALAALALAAAVLLFASGPAAAQSGGINPDGSTSTSSGGKTVPGKKAKLQNGLAIPPEQAPARVKRVIRAANEIAKGHGYCWGGGHSSFKSSCYDCSGAASYALHGGDFVSRPMPSTGYFNWGRKGRGEWISVFTNSGHMYLVVAGLRFDTSMVAGKGPGWSDVMRSGKTFRKRHPARF